MKRVITLTITNDEDFTVEDIARLIGTGAAEECDDQFRDLKVEVTSDDEEEAQ